MKLKQAQSSLSFKQSPYTFIIQYNNAKEGEFPVVLAVLASNKADLRGCLGPFQQVENILLLRNFSEKLAKNWKQSLPKKPHKSKLFWKTESPSVSSLLPSVTKNLLTNAFTNSLIVKAHTFQGLRRFWYLIIKIILCLHFQI